MKLKVAQESGVKEKIYYFSDGIPQEGGGGDDNNDDDNNNKKRSHDNMINNESSMRIYARKLIECIIKVQLASSTKFDHILPEHRRLIPAFISRNSSILIYDAAMQPGIKMSNGSNNGIPSVSSILTSTKEHRNDIMKPPSDTLVAVIIDWKKKETHHKRNLYAMGFQTKSFIYKYAIHKQVDGNSVFIHSPKITLKDEIFDIPLVVKYITDSLSKFIATSTEVKLPPAIGFNDNKPKVKSNPKPKQNNTTNTRDTKKKENGKGALQIYDGDGVNIIEPPLPQQEEEKEKEKEEEQHENNETSKSSIQTKEPCTSDTIYIYNHSLPNPSSNNYEHVSTIRYCIFTRNLCKAYSRIFLEYRALGFGYIDHINDNNMDIDPSIISESFMGRCSRIVSQFLESTPICGNRNHFLQTEALALHTLVQVSAMMVLEQSDYGLLNWIATCWGIVTRIRLSREFYNPSCDYSNSNNNNNNNDIQNPVRQYKMARLERPEIGKATWKLMDNNLSKQVSLECLRYNEFRTNTSNSNNNNNNKQSSNDNSNSIITTIVKNGVFNIFKSWKSYKTPWSSKPEEFRSAISPSMKECYSYVCECYFSSVQAIPDRFLQQSTTAAATTTNTKNTLPNVGGLRKKNQYVAPIGWDNPSYGFPEYTPECGKGGGNINWKKLFENVTGTKIPSLKGNNLL